MFLKRLGNIAVMALIMGSVVFTGCQEPGPAEEAGRELDEAVEELRDTLDPAGPAEQMGRDIDDVVENLQEGVDDLRERLEENGS